MRQARVTVSTTIALWLMSPFWASHASAVEEVARLSPSDAALGLGEGFGASVAISGDWIVVGAPKDDHFGYDAGAAYVFRRVGPKWIEQDKLLGSPLVNGKFGSSVAIDGDWIVVGSPGGIAAHVHHRDDRGTPEDFSDDVWLLAALLHPPPSLWCCGFARSVDIDGDLIVVGTRVNEYQVGRAYVFRWDGSEWLPDATLIGADTEKGDSFGYSVAVSGDVVVVGARDDDDAGDRSGSAYVFRYRGRRWVQGAKLVASDGEARDNFGTAVSTSGDCILVGAKNNRHTGGGRGSAYVFRRAARSWVEEDNLVGFDNVPFDGFGGSVAVDVGLVVVGSAGRAWAYLFPPHGETSGQAEILLGLEPTLAPPIDINERFAIVATHVYAVRDRLNLGDFADLQNCLVPGDPPPECQRFDRSHDGEIDLADYGEFLATFTGP